MHPVLRLARRAPAGGTSLPNLERGPLRPPWACMRTLRVSSGWMVPCEAARATAPAMMSLAGLVSTCAMHPDLAGGDHRKSSYDYAFPGIEDLLHRAGQQAYTERAGAPDGDERDVLGLQVSGVRTLGLGGGGEKLTLGLLMTPSDREAVAEAKCLLPRLPLLVCIGSSTVWNSKVWTGFHCSALAALVVTVMVSAPGCSDLAQAIPGAGVLKECDPALSVYLLSSMGLWLNVARSNTCQSLLSSRFAQR